VHAKFSWFGPERLRFELDNQPSLAPSKDIQMSDWLNALAIAVGTRLISLALWGLATTVTW
jgi:hypothetical protein